MQTKPVSFSSDSKSLVKTVGFELLGSDLGKDVKQALKAALAGGAVFLNGTDPLSIFRQTLVASIRDIERHPIGILLQKFLLKGPYEQKGRIPAELKDQRLSDAESASAITFIFSYTVNCFKGAITELLAARACLDLLRRLQDNGTLPIQARLYVGDTVSIHRSKGKGNLKGADLSILIEKAKLDKASYVIVAGVAEVKSYIKSKNKIFEQLDQHIRRSSLGLQIVGKNYPSGAVKIGYGKNPKVIRVAVQPNNWKLSRSFRFKESDNGRYLHMDRNVSPEKNDEIKSHGNNAWSIILKWSKEALAEAAFEMTFWYMEKIGEVVYKESRPKGWGKMSPAQAGRNAAKMMLYYAILRCRTIREEQRAIALYNSYGYGYALGMNFKNAEGRREMLWPEDLDEIISSGKTKNGCSFH